MASPEFERVAVHPIVLLSVADHHNRVLSDDQERRVVGILLGDYFGGQCNILSSFAVPFDEDGAVWFIDTNFIEEMYTLHRKVTLAERIVGWYSSRSTISPNDLAIHDSLRRYVPNPVFITTDVRAQDPHEIPVAAYLSTERVRPDGRAVVRSFLPIATCIEFLDMEEVGVGHLLRDVKDVDISEIGKTLTNSVHGLSALEQRLRGISDYLQLVIDGRLPVDGEVVGNTQSIFNLLPNLLLRDTAEALSVKSDDAAFMVFVSQVTKSVTSLHDLVNRRNPPVEAKPKTEDGKTKPK
jgi:26S proteasome regulatory subunit N8